MKEIKQKDQTIQFRFVEGSLCLRAEDIVYIETNRHKNLFYTIGGTYSIYRKMDELETDLQGMGFVRTHRSFLVNMRYIGGTGGRFLFWRFLTSLYPMTA